MYGYVYLTTNLVNGRKYVGKHRSSLFSSNYKGSGKILKQAFEKYGWDNFKVELLEECYSKDSLNEAEVKWIKDLNAVASHEFYNIGKGGEGWQVVLSGSRHPMYGRRGKESPLYGHPVSEETKHKISDKARSRVWINNGDEEFTVDKDESKEYIDKGWRYGRLSLSTESMKKSLKGNQIAKGRTWINNSNEEKMISQEEIDEYISKGFKIGRLSSSGLKGNQIAKGRVFFTNGKVNRMVRPEDIRQFLEDNPDFYKGKIFKYTK